MAAELPPQTRNEIFEATIKTRTPSRTVLLTHPCFMDAGLQREAEKLIREAIESVVAVANHAAASADGPWV